MVGAILRRLLHARSEIAPGLTASHFTCKEARTNYDDGVSTVANVLQRRLIYFSLASRKRLMVDLTVSADAVFREYAPPAMTFPHDLHFQIPTDWRFTEYLPQKSHRYLECWLTSIFLICLRRDAPYLVPYFPTIPTFLVRLACACAGGSSFHFVSRCSSARQRSIPRFCTTSHASLPPFPKTLVVGGRIFAFPFFLRHGFPSLSRVLPSTTYPRSFP